MVHRLLPIHITMHAGLHSSQSLGAAHEFMTPPPSLIVHRMLPTYMHSFTREGSYYLGGLYTSLTDHLIKFKFSVLPINLPESFTLEPHFYSTSLVVYALRI
jgi:hypothetical protein